MREFARENTINLQCKSKKSDIVLIIDEWK